MNETTMKTFKVFWAWQDEQEEAWLRKMSLQGWHLRELTFPTVYTFERGTPQDLIYRMDFITSSTKRDEYFQLFRDAGWVHLGQMGGWQYFRKASVDGSAPEIYTDAESKMQKYGRLLAILIVFLPIMMINFRTVGEHAENLPGMIFWIIYLVIYFLYIFALIKIGMRVITLKKRI